MAGNRETTGIQPEYIASSRLIEVASLSGIETYSGFFVIHIVIRLI
ncbi:MAG: hypothetical protein KBG82_02825 [Spirochaetes bacterium]|nr:hypothetical protein [Spirochaetota bacterium]